MSGKTLFTKETSKSFKEMCDTKSKDFKEHQHKESAHLAKQRITRPIQSLHAIRRVIQQQKHWKIIILVGANSSQANKVPVVFEAPERCVIDKRLEGYKKGLKAEDIYKAVDTAYDRVNSCSVSIKPHICEETTT